MVKERGDTAIYVAYDDCEPEDSARPEKNLLLAVLCNAMSDLNRTGPAGRKAREYFLNADEEYVFSFRSVCSYLNIDPRQVLIVTGLSGRASMIPTSLAPPEPN
jgi:hypothetical protein